MIDVMALIVHDCYVEEAGDAGGGVMGLRAKGVEVVVCSAKEERE